MADTASPELAPQKFSRYRSVRHAQHAQLQQSAIESQQTPPIPPMPPPPTMEPQNESPLSRSMSRYHRRPTTARAPAAKPPPLRSATVQVPAPATTAPAKASARYRALSSPQAQITEHVQPRLPTIPRERAEATLGSRQPTWNAREEAKQLMHDEAERHRRIKEKTEAEKREKQKAEQAERERQERQRREEDETERLRVQKDAEDANDLRLQKEEKERGRRLQKVETTKKTQEREEAERRARAEEAARKAHTSPPNSPPKHGGAFGMFRRRRDGSSASPESPSNGTKPPKTGYSDRDMENIKAGGRGAVLGIDAPISAVNAGDRRVTVVCNKQSILLLVTPETTAEDLLRSAATCMTERIDTRNDILVENFRKVGVKRALRLYEHVRDILNSWDNDTQNELVVTNAAYKDHKYDSLRASQVPDAKPEGMGCYIHYSSRPGKWNKRFIILRPDGQLVMAKNETSKDQDTICHLSDFDIYTPTDRKAGKIRPPKKHCFAIKSQQKSNIFSDETKYVHFFCTNDVGTSSRFHDAIQGWRSWHLKHVMGEGQKKTKAQEAKATNGPVANAKALASLEAGASSHARDASVDSYYQIGSFKPMFDANSFGKDLDVGLQKPGTQLKLDSKIMHARRLSARVKGPPPIAYNRNGLIDDVPSQPAEGTNPLTQSSARPESGTFASGGLLGRTYSQRQRAVQDREKKPSGPFTEGPSLVGNIDQMAQTAANNGGLDRRSSVRSTHRRTSSDIQRSASARAKPRPLVDLTPQYREPPQHRNKGKGFAPEAGTGPLIENATSMEEAIKVPSSTDWRARPPTARTHGTYGTGGHERTRSLKGRGEGLAAYSVNNHSGAPEDGRKGFTGGGLLARAGFSQGHQPVGRGVMDGSKARGPMLDLDDDNKFASGSLLADVQRRQASGGPTTDRDRQQSVDMG